jgi:hypothetical protein
MNEMRMSARSAAVLLALGVGCGDPRDGETPAEDGVILDGSETAIADDDGESGSSQGSTADEESSTDESSGDASDGTTEGCGGQLYSATSIPPNMMIVQDRSGSMDEEIDGNTKWELAKAALEQVVMAYDDQVLFGLMLYPGTDDSCDEGKDCGPGEVFVDIGPGTATPIIDALDASGLCTWGTPTAETLEPLRDYPGLEDVERPNYVLLITDGQSTCDNPVPEVEALRLEYPEIQTFVVGFGDGVDDSELNDMAQAGGTALQGDPKYYQADDAAALEAAFAEIAGNVLSCSYVLEEVPPDPNDLYIYIDGVLIERDVTHVEGWDYDGQSNQLTFYGTACQQLQSGDAQDLEIIFGCPTIG